MNQLSTKLYCKAYLWRKNLEIKKSKGASLVEYVFLVIGIAAFATAFKDYLSTEMLSKLKSMLDSALSKLG